MNPTDPNLCPECGKPVPPTSQHQVCPACLLRQALDSGTLVEGIPAATAPPPTPEEIAEKFPQFEVTECLGRGGMGVVYKARQKSLDRWVAIKILPPERVGEGKFAERFAREAATLAKLSHPNIVTIHDFGETGGLFYIVMEYVDGVNLRDLLREGKLDPKQALAIVPPICEALQYAHDKGIVHRDIKPENLLLDRDGRIKIADFGIAGLIGAGGDPIGTPPYMAPELAGAAPQIDHRADIYALGVVLYEMLTGERPAKDLVAPSKKVRIDVRLDEMVLRALEKSPELRYQTAGEFQTVVETMAGAMPRQQDLAASGLVKTERARLTVVESPGTRAKYPEVGEVALHGDRLVVSLGSSQRVIPLTNVTGLGEAVLAWWYSPAGHRFAAVDFEEAGQLRRVLFMPGAPLFATVGTSHLRAAEWLAAIRREVKTATGRELPVSTTISHHPVTSWMSLIWLLPVVAVTVAFLAKLLIKRSLGGPAENFRMEMLWQVLLFGWPALILVSIFIYRAWSIRRNRGAGELATPTLADAGGQSTPPFTNRAERELKRGGIVLVGRRNGQRIIVWRGVINAFFAAAGIMAIIGGLASLVRPFDPLLLILLALFPILLTAGGVVLGLRTPLEGLVGVDDSGSDKINPSHAGQTLPRGMFQRWWWVLLVMIPVGMLLGLAVGGVWSYIAPRQFEVRTTLQYQPVAATAERTAGPLVGWDFMAGLESDETLARLEQQLDLGTRWMRSDEEVRRALRQIITVDLIRGSTLAVVKVRSKNLEECLEIAKAIPKAYHPPEGASVIIVDAESMPERVAPNVPLILTVSTLAGMLLGLLLALPLMVLLQRFLPARAAAADDQASPASHCLANPESPDRRRHKMLRYGMIVCALGLPVGLALQLPVVWILSLVGLLVGGYKLWCRRAAVAFGPPALPNVVPAEQTPGLGNPSNISSLRPSLVPAVAIHAVLFAGAAALFVLVMPRFAALFQDWGLQLPIITRLILAPPPNWVILALPILLGLDVGCCYLARHVGGRRGLFWWTVGVIAGLALMAAVAVASITIPLRKMVETLGSETATRSAAPSAPPLRLATAPDERTDKIAVEDLALHLLVAIREKDDAKLKSLASDRIKGWPDALPVFAVELREYFRQITGDEKFDLRASESLVNGELAVVKCTGPETLKGMCLVLNFIKTAAGWRNHSLRNASEQTPLAEHLANLQREIQKDQQPQNPAPPPAAEKDPGSPAQ